MSMEPMRQSIRIRGHDYAGEGAYFVTICAKGRECVFGDIADGQMRLNEVGRIVEEEWLRSAGIRREIELDEFVIMPNHMHGVVILTKCAVGAHRSTLGEGPPPRVGAHGRAPLQRAARSLGSFIAGFKASVTKRINGIRGTPGRPVWQRNYYEHIIRNDEDLARIRKYVHENPLRWDLDEENPRSRIPGRS
jgi:REP element-mobilizing transposase RayT